MFFSERLKKEVGHKLNSLKKFMLVDNQFQNGKLVRTI